MRTGAEFPTDSLLRALGLGIPALGIALLFCTMVASYLGPQFDVEIMNDHVIGGIEDRITWMVVASMSGGAGIFCVLRFWLEPIEWRRERDAEVSRVAPR